MADDSQRVDDVEKHTMESNEQQPPPKESIETPHMSQAEEVHFHELFASLMMDEERKMFDKWRTTNLLQTVGATTDHGEPSVSGVFAKSQTEKRDFTMNMMDEQEKIIDNLKAMKLLGTLGATTDHGEPSVSGVFGLRSLAGACQQTTDSDNEYSSQGKMWCESERIGHLIRSFGKLPMSFTPISDEDSRSGSSENELSFLSDLSDDSDVDERRVFTKAHKS